MVATLEYGVGRELGNGLDLEHLGLEIAHCRDRILERVRLDGEALALVREMCTTRRLDAVFLGMRNAEHRRVVLDWLEDKTPTPGLAFFRLAPEIFAACSESIFRRARAAMGMADAALDGLRMAAADHLLFIELAARAVTAMWERLQRMARGACRSHPEDFGDLVGEAVLGVYDAIHHHDPSRGNFLEAMCSWAKGRIRRMVAGDHEYRARLAFVEWLEEEGHPEVSGGETREWEVMAEKALSMLPSEERRVIEMLYGFGDGERAREYTYREIAERLGCAIASVQRIEYRALRRIREAMGDFL